ncbi:unnamed protein product, partial [Amoebophrya sp. A120]|eukprot:GSA120T00005189001.1
MNYEHQQNAARSHSVTDQLAGTALTRDSSKGAASSKTRLEHDLNVKLSDVFLEQHADQRSAASTLEENKSAPLSPRSLADTTGGRLGVTSKEMVTIREDAVMAQLPEDDSRMTSKNGPLSSSLRSPNYSNGLGSPSSPADSAPSSDHTNLLASAVLGKRARSKNSGEQMDGSVCGMELHHNGMLNNSATPANGTSTQEKQQEDDLQEEVCSLASEKVEPLEYPPMALECALQLGRGEVSMFADGNGSMPGAKSPVTLSLVRRVAPVIVLIRSRGKILVRTCEISEDDRLVSTAPLLPGAKRRPSEPWRDCVYRMLADDLHLDAENILNIEAIKPQAADSVQEFFERIDGGMMVPSASSSKEIKEDTETSPASGSLDLQQSTQTLPKTLALPRPSLQSRTSTSRGSVLGSSISLMMQRRLSTSNSSISAMKRSSIFFGGGGSSKTTQPHEAETGEQVKKKKSEENIRFTVQETKTSRAVPGLRTQYRYYVCCVTVKEPERWTFSCENVMSANSSATVSYDPGSLGFMGPLTFVTKRATPLGVRTFYWTWSQEFEKTLNAVTLSRLGIKNLKPRLSGTASRQGGVVDESDSVQSKVGKVMSEVFFSGAVGRQDDVDPEPGEAQQARQGDHASNSLCGATSTKHGVVVPTPTFASPTERWVEEALLNARTFLTAASFNAKSIDSQKDMKNKKQIGVVAMGSDQELPVFLDGAGDTRSEPFFVLPVPPSA